MRKETPGHFRKSERLYGIIVKNARISMIYYLIDTVIFREKYAFKNSVSVL